MVDWYKCCDCGKLVDEFEPEYLDVQGALCGKLCLTCFNKGNNCPPLGITTKAKVTNVIDGDTVDVEIKRTLRVRLLDCWAPEIRTKDLVEKESGLISKKFLEHLISGKNVVLYIPASEDGEIQDVFTMGRALGRVYIKGMDVSHIMVANNMAKEDK